MSLFKLGKAAPNKHFTKATWNETSRKKKHHDLKGILQYSISRKAGWFPAYELAYSFLLAQEDIQINANPTVTTVNQTPAKIAIVEQISINTGVVEIDTTKATRLKDSYTRAEYGITIQVTPTIHAKVDDDDGDQDAKYITLSTDIIFDTTRPNKENRPDVTRRNIKNEVRIADGQTVILGGLRRKIASDDQEMIPFLGELPGIGKFFSTTSMQDSSTEMFIFLTPKIIPDPRDEFEKMRIADLLKRPGDIPDFLAEVVDAKKAEKNALFERSLKMLFGRPQDEQFATRSPELIVED